LAAGLLLLGAPYWWLVHRHGYREWFHLTILAAVLVAVADYGNLVVGWLETLILLGAPCFWLSYRYGPRRRLPAVILLGIVTFVLAALWVVVLALNGYALFRGWLHPPNAYLTYDVPAMSIIGALVGRAMWGVAYRRKYPAPLFPTGNDTFEPV